MKHKILFSIFLLILFTRPYVASEIKDAMKPQEICIEGLAYAVISNKNGIAMAQVFIKHPANTPKLCGELLEQVAIEKERIADEGQYAFLAFLSLILIAVSTFFAYRLGVKKKGEEN